MAKVVWSEAALRDLDDVAQYVAKQSPEEAASIVREALDRADSRSHFSEDGSIVPECNSPRIREILGKKSFRLIYEIQDQTVLLLSFIRCTKHLPSNLGKPPNP